MVFLGSDHKMKPCRLLFKFRRSIVSDPAIRTVLNSYEHACAETSHTYSVHTQRGRESERERERVLIKTLQNHATQHIQERQACIHRPGKPKSPACESGARTEGAAVTVTVLGSIPESRRRSSVLAYRSEGSRLRGLWLHDMCAMCAANGFEQ